MKLQLTADGGFRMEGDIENTFQLIYEALEIASRSDDIFAPDFAALASSLMEETADWMN